MRGRLVSLTVLALALPAGASAQTGGAAAPSPSGGVAPGQPVHRAQPSRPRRASARSVGPLTAKVFAVAPEAVQVGGPPALFTYEVTGAARPVRIRIDVVSGSSVVKRIHLGYKPTGVLLSYAWRPAGHEVPPGTYLVRLHATDVLGHALRRTATASGRSRLEVRVTSAPAPAVGTGVFPVRGTYDFGGPDARFGAPRKGHTHQGQDVMAPEGAQLVAPVAGAVYFTGDQPGAAGVYLVLRADDGRDMAFMHLQEGSLTLSRGDRVAAGQPIGLVGHTGDAEGPHLHFEIWPGGWYAKGSSPVDPLAQLQAWAGGAGPTPTPTSTP